MIGDFVYACPRNRHKETNPTPFLSMNKQGVLVDLVLGWQRFSTPLTLLVLKGTRASETDLKLLAQVCK